MRRVLAVLLAVAVVACAPASAFGADAIVDVTPASLASLVEELDGATVRFSGEVVSETLRADESHVWLNVLQGGVAMGVYLPAEMAETVTAFGEYSQTGDQIQVIGVYNEACDEHGGDMDVHAAEILVIAAGSPREQRPELWKGAVGLVGLLAAYLQLRRFRRMRDEVIS